jgi:V/A-type H+-transporting ATPase subunit F
MKFFVIGDQEMVLGFQLAGLEGKVVNTAEEAQQALDDIFKREDIGIILISERIASEIRVKVNQYLYKTTFPLILEIPDRHGPIENRPSIREMVRSAVGVHF